MQAILIQSLNYLYVTPWSTDIVTNSTDVISISIEKYHSDTGTYERYSGIRSNNMTLTFAPNALILVDIDVRGKEQTLDTAIVSGATYTAAPTSNSMDGSNHVTSLLIDGSVLPASNYFLGATFGYNNNARRQPGIGSLTDVGVGQGGLDMTGTLDMYHADNVMKARLLAGTEFALKITVDDGTNSYIFEQPKAVLTSGSENSSGENTDAAENYNYVAYYDSGISGTVKVTRT